MGASFRLVGRKLPCYPGRLTCYYCILYVNGVGLSWYDRRGVGGSQSEENIAFLLNPYSIPDYTCASSLNFNTNIDLIQSTSYLACPVLSVCIALCSTNCHPIPAHRRLISLPHLHQQLRRLNCAVSSAIYPVAARVFLL